MINRSKNAVKFKVRASDGILDNYLIDGGGNVFENGACINPLVSDLVQCEDTVWRHPEIGYNAPKKEDRLPSLKIVGYVDVTSYLAWKATVDKKKSLN